MRSNNCKEIESRFLPGNADLNDRNHSVQDQRFYYKRKHFLYMICLSFHPGAGDTLNYT